MKRQLEHLTEASQWPNVTRQVLEFSSGFHPALHGPIAIIELVGQAYVEEREKEVTAQVEAFHLLRAAALPPADSAELIRTTAGNSLPS
jgi:hypothetical protein